MESATSGRSSARRLPSPAEIAAACPTTARVRTVVENGRRAIVDCLEGSDGRLAVIVGPCSIHDPDAARDYAHRLAEQRQRLADDLEIVMRVYFEKPRTTTGWKGLINDPWLDGSHAVETGLGIARTLLRDVNELGLPTATEFLDPLTHGYFSDLVSWGAVGARTTESQTHREVASSLAMPVGFKNGTDGNVRIAADAMISASRAHHHLSIDGDGAICKTVSRGNPYAHIVLRGGRQPNYDAASVNATGSLLESENLRGRLFVDASHANSARKHRNQIAVCGNIGAQLADGSRYIAGVMIESNLMEGRQDLGNGKGLEYGKSVTDACLSWEDTVEVLSQLARSAGKRRKLARAEPSGLATA
ncbi:3-deoxy-7-phosphoheptulonate synthase [Burkholderia plantarii]|uniref:3-deoxy-7-phosphoheptulonate synthase n=1 Tax=Burkholderia plantarii TaxID=41899 RepID=UPI0018DD5D08|nr:3-deoxy-7-phosphoheptulonate synthase [Burkholderia plantarii]MBI0326071.1 3-deoxy-7-phosphoheptulonate synthase [Burkholderia plantarii]